MSEQRSAQNEIPVGDHVSLVERMMPMDFTSYMGQNHVIGPDTVFRNFLDIGEIPSMILWGPSGCGKVIRLSKISNS